MLSLNKIYKTSNSSNNYWNVFRTILQTSIFWFIFLYLIPNAIVKLENENNSLHFENTTTLGWIPFGLFSFLGLFSGYTMSWFGKGTPLPFDCPQKLVVAGLYKYVRNPMALAGIGQGASVGIILGSPMVIIYALIGAFLWHYLVRPSEEADLLKRFGDQYIRYQKDIKCWVPDFKLIWKVKG